MMTRIFLALFLIQVAIAFVPQHKSPAFAKTALNFGFLKELGLEKPSWLPDFGGKEEEEAAAPAAEDAEAEAEASEEAEAVAEE